MTDSGLLIEAIERATKEVFETMLGSEVSLASEEAVGRAESGVVSLVGLTGAWSGTGTICCSPEVAKLIAVRMLMLDPQDDAAIDDDVLDAVAELTNMVIGNVKNLITDSLGEMAISIPTVVYGRNFRFKNSIGTKESVGLFEWENHRFEVKLCLAPTSERSSMIRDRVAAPLFSAQ